MSDYAKVGLVVVVVAIGVMIHFSYSVDALVARHERCTQAGGIMYEGKCFKKEVLIEVTK